MNILVLLLVSRTCKPAVNVQFRSVKVLGHRCYLCSSWLPHRLRFLKRQQTPASWAPLLRWQRGSALRRGKDAKRRAVDLYHNATRTTINREGRLRKTQNRLLKSRTPSSDFSVTLKRRISISVSVNPKIYCSNFVERHICIIVNPKMLFKFCSKDLL